MNAPNLGEFNNLKVTPFIEPDPTIERKFKNGVIYIATECRHKKGNHRHRNHMSTRYDCRNDPAWHVKNRQSYALSGIISTGDEVAKVERLDDLQILDENGQILSHDRVERHLSLLNGEMKIGQFGTQTSMHRQNQGQKSLTKLQRRVEEKGEVWEGSNEESRERRQILDSFDKQFLQVCTGYRQK